MPLSNDDSKAEYELLTVTPTPYLKCADRPNLFSEVDGLESWLELDKPHRTYWPHRKVTHEEFERFALANGLALPPSYASEQVPRVEEALSGVQPSKLGNRERDNLLKTIAALLRMYIASTSRSGKKYGTPDAPNYHQLSILIDEHLMKHKFSNMGMATRTLADRLKQSISTLMAEKKT